jgi:hypothetical protein
MPRLLIILAAVGVALSAGCSKKTPSEPARQATITLKNGSGFAGMVTKSSTESITMSAPNGETRTYPMDQVASVEYLPPAGTPPQTVAAVPPAASAAAAAPAPSAVTASEAAPAAPAPEAPIAIDRVVPVRTRIEVRNNEAIDSKTAAPGQKYSAVVVQSVSDTRGRVIIPHGSAATLVVRSVRDQGKVEGQSELALDIESVAVGGRRYRVETTDIVEKGKPGVGANGRTGKFVGGGAVLGTLLGAVAGGGRGAAIGALSGAAAGTATQAVTRGHGVRVPAETLMTFRLEAPIHVRVIQ